ncbi:hypothetical protein C5748_21035 [Phyllobacterium phragmitis]|uniref:Flagellar biosynthesis protein FliO n=1 Tax=Phyllobacterium phragmitis TaxID=2670329 RepID=A0A2S9IM27_9HYPH|nr:flagellar biosynthetic protein FliO [Phyllobacterium phragmitis]PRD41567.1 hypothetical protein C5748_21035 [Phyllobacterium phragmitis]
MNEWLTGIVGENAARIAGFILLFLLILVAIVIVFAIIRRLTGGTFVAGGRGRAPRLSVMDAAAVDNRRRLVLVRRDDIEHLILIGGPTDVVVEQNIVHAARTQSRGQASKAEPEPFVSAPASSPAFAANHAREPQATETRESEPPVASEPALPIAPPVSASSARQQRPQASPSPNRIPERPQERIQERPRPPAAPSRPAAPPVQMPSAPKPAPQFTQAPRPASAYPPQPRTVLPPQPSAQPAPHARHPAHPAYPLSQVAKGVITTTAGAAAAGMAQAHEPEKTGPKPSSSDMDMPEGGSKTGFEESPAEPFSPAPSIREDTATGNIPKEDISGKLDTFGSELHDAILDDFAMEEAKPAENSAEKNDNPPTGENIPDAELVNIVEDEPSSELNISPTEDASEKPETGNLEDEMEKLLGELSKSNRH